MKSKLNEAIQFRKDNKPDQALTILSELLKANPNDPAINYQMAWTCDFMGKESEAVPWEHPREKTGSKRENPPPPNFAQAKFVYFLDSILRPAGCLNA
jgi:hypothetical protein